MRRTTTTFLAATAIALAGAVHAGVVDELLTGYQRQGAADFSAARGEKFWNATHPDPESGGTRSCQTCHGTDLHKSGKHAKTGKVIDPLAPSTNAERLTDAKKIEKWFKRNCKWTIGRECTVQEKGDILKFLQSQ